MTDVGRMSVGELVGKVLADEHADVLRQAVVWLAQELMEAEVSQAAGAAYGERSGDRVARRNGYRERPWDTRVGSIELAIPRLRSGSYFPSFLEPPLRASAGRRRPGGLCQRGVDPQGRPAGGGPGAGRGVQGHRLTAVLGSDRQDLGELAGRGVLHPRGDPEPLGTLEWVDRAENLAVAGPSGTGKSHFVQALAHAAIEADLRVAWFTLESLTTTITKAKADATIARTVARICRCDLIVVDDIGMLPAGQDAAEAFYRVIDAAYERRSVAVTSNIHPSGSDQIMPKTLATATVDRLLHHAHLVLTTGDSHRLAEALAGKGVMPLS